MVEIKYSSILGGNRSPVNHALIPFLLLICSVILPGTLSGDLQNANFTSAREDWQATFAKSYNGGPTALQKAIKDRFSWNYMDMYPSEEKLLAGLLLSKNKKTNFGYNRRRLDALGPIIPCPKSLRSVFGKGDQEKRVCANLKVTQKFSKVHTIIPYP